MITIRGFDYYFNEQTQLIVGYMHSSVRCSIKENTMDYTNTWGVYQCFQGTNDNMVDLEDRESFFSINPNGKVFECVSSAQDMLVLQYGERRFKVNSCLYKMVDEPKFRLKSYVKIVKKSIVGQVIEINWHLKDNEPFYYLEIEGKRSSHRYKENELEFM